MKKCNKCGCENSDEARFCQCCGSQLEQAQKKYCDSCGAELSPGAMFCKVCGKKLVADGTVEGQDTQPDKKNKSRNKIIIAGAIILVVLIGIISIVAVRAKKGKDGNGSRSKEMAEQLLENSGFVADSYHQLGFYRVLRGYKYEGEDEDDGCDVYAEDISDKWYMHIEDYSFLFDGYIITQDSVDYVLRSMYKEDDDGDKADDLDTFHIVRSDDEIIVYEQDFSKAGFDDVGGKRLLICICNTHKVFDVAILWKAFEEFIDEDGVTHEKGEVFTDETYQAFIDTLRYTGSY